MSDDVPRTVQNAEALIEIVAEAHRRVGEFRPGLEGRRDHYATLRTEADDAVEALTAFILPLLPVNQPKPYTVSELALDLDSIDGFGFARYNVATSRDGESGFEQYGACVPKLTLGFEGDLDGVQAPMRIRVTVDVLPEVAS